MMKHYAAKLCTLSVALLFNSFLLLAQVPAYYNGTDISQTGNNLKNELAALITQTHTTNLSYTPGVWEALKQTDLDPDNPENVLLIYGYNDNDGNLQTDRTRDKDSNGGSTGDWNREHVFAKSLGNPNLGTSGPGADAHHLRASDVSMNSSRGNLPFEDASGNARRINNSWYPGDEWKGDVARMIMYMYLRYGDRCLPSAVGVGAQTYSSDMMDVFLEWNAEDPVSQYERNRNNILENIQGNRNPFIDNPVFATSIWGGPQAEDRFGDSTPAPVAEVLINEIDADTPGSDAMEFIELYDGGAGNTSLNGMVLVLYNGSIDESYRTIDLSGYSTDADGYFVLGNEGVANVSLTFPGNTLQNGADAVALYSGSVADFPNGSSITTENLLDAIAYDTNDSDDAEILTLLNAGEPQVNEGELGDKDNHSLQRMPNGGGGARNTSTYSPAVPTPGIANTNGGDDKTGVLINEIDADTPGSDALEFIELYDGGTGNTSLDGLVLVLYNGSIDESYRTIDLSGYSTDADGYFVLGNEAVANVSLIFPGNTLQNGADAVALYSGSAADFPNGSAITTENLLDAIAYDTNDSDDAEILTLLNAGEPQVNEGELGDKDNHSLQRMPNGEGGTRNTSSYTPAIPTPGTANGNGGPGAENVLINEIDADTPGSDALEFVELYDGGTGNTSLDGLVLVLYNGSIDESYATFDLSGYATDDNGYFVLGNEAVANVSLIFPGNTLQNGADAAALYSGSAADFPNGSAITTENLLDAIAYDTNDDDDAEILTLLNAGEPQVNEGGEGDKDNHSLQRMPNGEGGARNTSPYSPAIPTPGASNGGTTEPTEPVTIAEARDLPDGTTVTISGVLTVANEFAGSAYIQDSTGAIAVFDQSVHGEGVFAIGDSITLTGTRSSYNNQLQISPVSSVTDNGMPNVPVTPVEIALAEMGEHPAELVSISDATFPRPGDMLFGNSNYVLSGDGGTGELRIDNDAEDIVGLAQPDTCTTITGVVGKYQEIYQLLPRMKTDLPCAEAYIPEGDDLNIPRDQTLDVATWNIEWFGDESNSPAAGDPDSDMIQKDSVKTIIAAMDADVIAVEEISDDALFAQMVSEMDGYDYVLSDYTSYPNSPGVKQKVGFIYKTSTVIPVATKPLLASIHPYYNGGDDSALTDYPNDPTRFFASGRLPFLMTADVTIDGSTEQISFIALHARANSSNDPQSRYDMRKYDVEVLKDSLDAMYADTNLFVLGDYNDDVDETVADNVNTTITSYEAYMNDGINYNVVSSSLSDGDFRSYVFRENMIDHIMVSNELNDNFIEGSARVGYEHYDSDYTYTASDHFPVSARFRMQALELAGTETTDVSCNGAEDGSASVMVSGGLPPYTYAWSNGEETAGISGLPAGTYSVTVTDASGTKVMAEAEITEPEAMVITIDGNKKVYPGYDPEASAILSAEVTGGKPGYTYTWSTGDTGPDITVSPEETTVYTLTVTDDNGCSADKEITVEAENILCGNDGFFNKIQICYKGKTLCLPEIAAKQLLRIGATLGACDNNADGPVISGVFIFPNPVIRDANIVFRSSTETAVTVELYDRSGNLVYTDQKAAGEGRNRIAIDLSGYRRGMYICKLIPGDGGRTVTKKILKL